MPYTLAQRTMNSVIVKCDTFRQELYHNTYWDLCFVESMYVLVFIFCVLMYETVFDVNNSEKCVQMYF
jgi:hypothetical protein